MGLKESDFSGSQSAERVRELQALCGDECDGILVIGGVDSFQCNVAQAVLKFLFLGASGQELLGEQVIPQDTEHLEDIVLFLGRDRISIFYSSESDAAVTVLPKISHWRQVTEYTIHDGMEPDEHEARKIAAFKSMMVGSKVVGIPFGVDAHGRDLTDTMIPEKWPLIQSFGLEDGRNGHGFFTMNHRVINVSARILALMARIDTFYASRVVHDVEPLLMHHFDQFLLKLDRADSPAARAIKSEMDMGEDLLSFYEFGTMQYESRGLTIGPLRGSRVLFGKQTSNIATKSSRSAFLANSGGVTNHHATHMLVQTEDPFTGVRMCRTYFLSTGKTTARIVDEDALVHPAMELLEAHRDKADNSQDTALLIELYVLLLRGFHSMVKTLVNMSVHDEDQLAQLKATAMRAMIDQASQTQVFTRLKIDKMILEDNLVIQTEFMDSCGRATTMDQRWNLVYVTAELRHVPSQLVVTEPLGSLVVGDTILFQSQANTNLANNDEGRSRAPAYLSVTKSFPYFRSWIQNGKEADFAHALDVVLKSDFMLQSPALRLGKPLCSLDYGEEAGSDGGMLAGSAPASIATNTLTKVMMLLESDELPLLHGRMRLFTGGFVFQSPHLNPIIVSIANDVECFRIVSTAFEELVLLQLELKVRADRSATTLADAMPFSSQSRLLALPLLSGSRFQEEILKALPNWKQTALELDVPFYRPHDLQLPIDGSTPRDADQIISPYFARTTELLVRKQRRESVQQDTRTIEQFFPKVFIPKESNPTTTLSKPKADSSKWCVPVTVCIGVPGSDVHRIADTVVEISSASCEWTHLSIDLREMKSTVEDAEKQAVATIRSQLNKALNVIKDASSMQLHPRVMISVTGYVDPMSVACAIKGNTYALPLQVKLSTIIACVSATNVYLPDALAAQNPFPRLFDQLTAGFATHIVLTHASDVTQTHLGRLRYHIDQVNPFADIHVLSRDVFEGPITPLLAVDRFESPYYRRYRDAHFPGWERTTATGLSPFVAELVPPLAPSTIVFKIAPGIEKSRFFQLVGHELTPFAVLTKSVDKIHPLSHRVKDGKGIRIAQALATEKVLHSRTAMDNGQGQSLTSDAVQQFGSCWCVQARLQFAGDKETVYEYVSTGSFARLAVLGESTGTPLSLTVTGVLLNADKIRDLLLECYANVHGRTTQPLRTAKSISLEEKREIQQRHAMDPLPDGYLFDGVNYVDFFGGRYEFHPEIDKFIEEHLATSNAETNAANKRVEATLAAQERNVTQVV